MNIFSLKWLRTRNQSSKSKKPMFKRLYPSFEQLEIRWMPSAVTLGLYNDTSIGAKFTSDGRLQGSISDPGYSVASKTVTFTGGVTGTATSDANGYFLFTPTLSSQGAYNSIVASFTDHTSTTINSPSFSFTYDTVAPSVTLTAPANSDSATFQVTASATDTNALPNGTVVRLDVDLNNNSSFNDAGEQNYTSAILTSGSATFSLAAAVPAGTYKLRARVFDQAANVGASSTQTTVVNPWATASLIRTIDPEQSTALTFGLATVFPATGGKRLTHPLDFDQSPGTSVGGNPALVSDSGSPRPIIEATLASDPGGAVPTDISVQLTWNNGSPQTAVDFATTGHSAGDVYLLSAQVASAVSSTGAYPWSLSMTANFSGSGPVVRNVSGTAYVVASTSDNPLWWGWSIAGVDHLVSFSGGVIWVYGAGGLRVFTGSGPTFVSPPNDLGTLVQSGGNYTYTSKDQWKWNFNSSGLETSLVDPHNLAISYSYSSGRLVNVNAPDGALVTLTYQNDMTGKPRLAAIYESGGRTVTLTGSSYTGSLSSITDPDSSTETFAGSVTWYSTSAAYNVTFTFDSNTGLLSGVDRGLGTSLSLAPAAARGLASSPARSANQAVAVVTDGLSQLTTYTLDSTGRLLKLQTPDGGVQAWQRDQAGQPLTYSDPLNRVTTLQYQYGSGAGDLKQLTYPDGSTNQLQYDGTFHNPTQFQDTLHHLSSMTYDGSTGDLLTTKNALNQVTTQTWSAGLRQTATDALGNTTSYQYDTQRRLQVIQDALNDLTTLSYDSTGNLSTAKDALGRVTTTVFDGKNRLTKITNAAGGVTTLVYNTMDKVINVTDPLGLQTASFYDQRGWKTTSDSSYGMPSQVTSTIAYDALGRITATTDANNHSVTMTYDAMGRMLTRKSAVGGVQTLTYDLAGQMLTSTDEVGHTTTLSYNNRGWQTAVLDPLSNRVTMAYDTEGNVLSVQDARGNFTTYGYDALNRLVQRQDPLGNLSTVAYDAGGNTIAQIDARGNATSMAYDALNRVTAVTDPLNHTVTAVYDAVGNVIRTLDALGNAVTLVYDALNRRTSLQDPGGGIATTVYDGDSNVVNTIDQLGHKVTYAYDTLNRQTAVTDARGGVTTTAYDAVNNVVSVKDSVNNTTTFLYDSANRMTQQTDPLNHSSTYSYDLANRSSSTTDRDGRRIDNTYDAGNRLTQQNWIVSGSTVNTLTFTYDPNGNLLTAANNAGAYTMTYDALNRVTQTQEPFGLTLTATYDAVGNRTKLQDSFGGVLTSVYDSANRLTSRQFGGASQTPLRIDLTYTARNQVATEIRYSDLGAANKVASTTFTYDPATRLTSLQDFNSSGGSIANYTYAYDLASRDVTQTLNGATTTYSYDTTNQLTSDGTNNYTYDLNGNRTLSGYQTGAGNELTNDGVWTYTYDAEGNLTKKSKGTSAETWTYGYDNQNHMTSAKDSATDGGTVLTLATYVYDALGNRLEKDVWTQASGTTTVTRFGYDGQEICVDLTSANALQTRYIHGDAVDELFARISSAGTAASYLTDRLGSVRDIVNNTGSVIDHIDYDGFGNVTNETSPSNGDRYKWTGREFDTETGFEYNRARYLDSRAGRWTSEDPLGMNATDSNIYRYVRNDPPNAVDPSGLDASPIGYPPYPSTCPGYYISPPRPAPTPIGGEYLARMRLSGDEWSQAQIDKLHDAAFKAGIKVAKANIALGILWKKIQADKASKNLAIFGEISKNRELWLERLRKVHDTIRDPGEELAYYYQPNRPLWGVSEGQGMWTQYYPFYISLWTTKMHVMNDFFTHQNPVWVVYHEWARYILMLENEGAHNVNDWDAAILYLNQMYDKYGPK